MLTASAHRRVAVVAVLLALAGGLAACSSKAGPDKALKAYLNGVHSGNLSGVQFVIPSGSAIGVDAVTAEINTLFGDLGAIRPTMKVHGKIKTNGANANATVDVDWPVNDKVHWTYPTTVRLARIDDQWKVIWTPANIETQLKSGDRLKVRTTTAPRAEIMDGAGQPMITAHEVIVVGIHPKDVANINQLVADLDAAFKSVKVDVDMSDLPARVAGSSPDNFVEVVVLRKEVYDLIRNRIHDLPGTQFREEVRQLGPVTGFARSLLGTVGPVTAEQLKNNPGKYREGDQAGQGGIQAQFEDQLRGTPGVVVTINNAATDADPNVAPVEVFRSNPKPGTALKTTLDVKIQKAADAAVASQKTLNSVIVAIRVSSGEIVAVANGPDESGPNFGFTAQVAPGSTFKMVTAYGVLKAGDITPDTIVNCPKTLNVGGRVFANAHGFELGAVPLRTDLAKSCNTAFASLAPKLGPTGLHDAAGELGIGGDWKVGGPEVFTGSVGTNGSDVDQAAAAFGQGDTLVSPIALACAAATVARGKFVAPVVIKTDAVQATGQPLNATALEQLRGMLREVVTTGTGTQLTTIPGDPIFGKTGTAEFDTEDPNLTHSWFVGFSGDLAFAVFVEKGGLSTESAVPLTRKFLLAVRS
jgi:cell division protein FtsI/penicillin-binding protein 2